MYCGAMMGAYWPKLPEYGLCCVGCCCIVYGGLGSKFGCVRVGRVGMVIGEMRKCVFCWVSCCAVVTEVASVKMAVVGGKEVKVEGGSVVCACWKADCRSVTGMGAEIVPIVVFIRTFPLVF